MSKKPTYEELEQRVKQLEIQADRRKMVEDALQESEEKFQLISEQSIAGIHIIQHGVFKYINQTSANLIGHSIEEIMEWPPFEFKKLIHPDDLPFVMEQYRKKQDREKDFVAKYQWRIVSKDGATKWIESYSRPVSYRNENADLVVMLDITDRKLADEELRNANQYLEMIIDNANIWLNVLDEKSNIMIWNKAAEEISGFLSEEVVGHGKVWEWMYPESKYRREIIEKATSIIEKNEVIEGFETTIRRKDGEDRIISWNSRNLVNNTGTPIGSIAIGRDITDKRYLETQLIQAQKMEAVGTLAGGIAHDFNNILSAIIGYTELTQMKLTEDIEVLGYLGGILKAGGRAKDLVQQILTFSRQAEHELKPVRIDIILKETIKFLRATLPATIQIHQNIKSESLIMGDPTQFHQVLMNLCTNAGYAMQEKGGVLEVNLVDVKVASEFAGKQMGLRSGRYIRLSVSDTGHGVLPEVMDRIFDPFFTTKEKGRGTGMGLSVVHGIVKSYGGTISVYSEPEKGSTFNVFFPAMKEKIESEICSEKLIPRGDERILFIDDEADITNIGKKILESLGYDVTIRTNSIDALKLFKEQPDKFDLVITDMTMPELTGEDLVKELIKIRPDISIILCTGFSLKIDKQKAREIGVSEFVLKPILSHEIAETIRKVLDN